MSRVKAATSRHRPGYLSILVYMLQDSGYSPRYYLSWLSRTRDFGQVMRRKKLVMTTKAKLLLAWLWLLLILSVTVIGFIIGAQLWATWITVLVVILFLVALPYFLAIAVLIPLVVGNLVIQKPRTKSILKRTRKTLAAHPATKIAIAGSFGKTTFKEILATTLSQKLNVAATPANYNTPLGIARFAAGLTGDEEVLIFELGEYYPGDIKELSELVLPDMGIITGINEAHLERFKTLDRTVATIYELADYLDERPLWVNGESKLANDNVTDGAQIYTRKGVGKLKVQHAKTSVEGTTFNLVGAGKKMKIESGLLGLHNVGPLAAAASIGLELGLSATQIQKGLNQTKAFEHRLQPSEAGGIITLDDTYNGNPDGVRAVIDFLRGLDAKRKLYVTPGIVEVGDASAKLHETIGRQLADACDVVVLVRNSATPYIAAGLEHENFKGEVVWYDDGLSCLAALPHITKPGDVVLMQNDWGDSYA